MMVEATAERVALALEGARLLDEAQKRAAREAFLSEVATKLSASFQLDSILRDTVQELGQTLKNSTVTFQLVNPATSTATAEEKSNGISVHRKESDASNEH
jgi:GAF domain-containing protein